MPGEGQEGRWALSSAVWGSRAPARYGLPHSLLTPLSHPLPANNPLETTARAKSTALVPGPAQAHRPRHHRPLFQMRKPRHGQEVTAPSWRVGTATQASWLRVHTPMLQTATRHPRDEGCPREPNSGILSHPAPRGVHGADGTPNSREAPQLWPPDSSWAPSLRPPTPLPFQARPSASVSCPLLPTECSPLTPRGAKKPRNTTGPITGPAPTAVLDAWGQW